MTSDSGAAKLKQSLDTTDEFRNFFKTEGASSAQHRVKKLPLPRRFAQNDVGDGGTGAAAIVGGLLSSATNRSAQESSSALLGSKLVASKATPPPPAPIAIDDLPDSKKALSTNATVAISSIGGVKTRMASLKGGDTGLSVVGSRACETTSDTPSNLVRGVTPPGGPESKYSAAGKENLPMSARKFRPRSSSILVRAKVGKTPDWGRPQRIAPGEDTEDTEEGPTKMTVTVGQSQEPAASQETRTGSQQTVTDHSKGLEVAQPYVGQTRPRQDPHEVDTLEPASKRKKHESPPHEINGDKVSAPASVPTPQPCSAGVEATKGASMAEAPQLGQLGGGIAAIARTLAKGAPRRTPSQDSQQPVTQQAQQQTSQSNTGRVGSTVSQGGVGPLGATEKAVIMVNNRPFTKLHTIGQGGSSKVYKVVGPHNKIYALKRVTFEKQDAKVAEGYLNEFDLLRKLDKCPNIITAFDAEINRAKGRICMVLECGDVDLAHMMLRQKKKPLDLNFIRHSWSQMLEAVKVVHDMNIVHTDLKPANFVLVEGVLKLIDFGIAGAISPDTTNLHRVAQMGTANYMPPEAFGEANVSGFRKLGRAADVWSLGCILYQMVYGKTPFSEFEELIQKMLHIINPKYEIKYPEETVFPPSDLKGQAKNKTNVGTTNGESKDAVNSSESESSTLTPSPPGSSSSTPPPYPETVTRIRIDISLINVMKRILVRDPKKRPTIPQLLEDPFLHPQDELFRTREQLRRAEAELSKLGIGEARHRQGAQD